MKESLNQKQDKDNFEFTKSHRRLLYGPVFLIATPATSPVSSTQTAVFMAEFYVSFALVILISILTDTGAQINIRRALVVTGLCGQKASNKVLPGLRTLTSILIAFGGLTFSIGGIAGAGLGLGVMSRLDVRWGVAITAIFAILIFVSKNGQEIMDTVSTILGVIMISVVAYVMVISNPPYGDALIHSVALEHPTKLTSPAITLVGETVGGYVTSTGTHRILDSRMKGKEFLSFVNRPVITGILTTGIMRTLLFLAALGVAVTGVVLNADNPPASVFGHAIEPTGKNILGVVIPTAVISSIIGSIRTSVTFLKALHRPLLNKNNLIVIIFVVISTVISLLIGKPVNLPTITEAINGWILPITLGAISIASRKKLVVGDYKHPTWVLVFGIVTVTVTIITGILSL